MHFRRFIVDFSVITPNWIVKFQYVDEKNTVFHVIKKNLDKFEAVSQCCEKVITTCPFKKEEEAYRNMMRATIL